MVSKTMRIYESKSTLLEKNSHKKMEKREVFLSHEFAPPLKVGNTDLECYYILAGSLFFHSCSNDTAFVVFLIMVPKIVDDLGIDADLQQSQNLTKCCRI